MRAAKPGPFRQAKLLQATLRFLLSQLPRAGCLRETWQLLQTAYEMERGSRPSGMVVSEFDQLFRTALKSTLECIVRSASRWKIDPNDAAAVTGIAPASTRRSGRPFGGDRRSSPARPSPPVALAARIFAAFRRKDIVGRGLVRRFRSGRRQFSHGSKGVLAK